MIDLNELNRIADENSNKEFIEKMRNHIAEVEKFIDKNLLENARNGKRELEIIFTVQNFLTFHSVVNNYLNYRNHGYDVDFCADEVNNRKNEFIISGDLLVEFLYKISTLDDNAYILFLRNNDAWKNFMKKYLMIEVNFIKVKINF